MKQPILFFFFFLCCHFIALFIGCWDDYFLLVILLILIKMFCEVYTISSLALIFKKQKIYSNNNTEQPQIYKAAM